MLKVNNLTKSQLTGVFVNINDSLIHLPDGSTRPISLTSHPVTDRARENFYAIVKERSDGTFAGQILVRGVGGRITSSAPIEMSGLEHKGVLLERTGNYTEALEIFARLRPLAERAAAEELVDNRASLAVIYRGLGACLVSLHRHQEALEPLQKAIPLFSSLGTEEAPLLIADCLFFLGQALFHLGNFSTAISPLLAFLSLCPNPPPLDVAQANWMVGVALSDASQHAAAIPFLQEALTIRIRDLGAGHELTGRTHYALGEAYFSLGQWAEAHVQQQTALVIFRQRLGEDHDHTIETKYRVGLSLLRKRRLQESAILLHNSLTVAEQKWGRNHLLVGQLYDALGIILLQEWRMRDEGLYYKRTALEILTGLLGEEHEVVRALCTEVEELSRASRKRVRSE